MLPGAAGAETSIWVVTGTDSSPTVAVAPAAALARDRVLPVSAAERAVAVHGGGASARVPAVMPARSCQIAEDLAQEPDARRHRVASASIVSTSRLRSANVSSSVRSSVTVIRRQVRANSAIIAPASTVMTAARKSMRANPAMMGGIAAGCAKMVDRR